MSQYNCERAVFHMETHHESVLRTGEIADEEKLEKSESNAFLLSFPKKRNPRNRGVFCSSEKIGNRDHFSQKVHFGSRKNRANRSVDHNVKIQKYQFCAGKM